MTSPRLNTLWPGSQDGVAKMSPKMASFASGNTAELANSPGAAAWPDYCKAADDAGSVPPFRVMVTPFSRPPAPMNRMPGSRRLSHKQTAAMTYDAMCAAASAEASPPWSDAVPAGCGRFPR